MKPIPILVERPAKVRNSISRPRLSVPKGCKRLGASRAIERSLAAARGDTKAPNTATLTESQMMQYKQCGYAFGCLPVLIVVNEIWFTESFKQEDTLESIEEAVAILQKIHLSLRLQIQKDQRLYLDVYS